MGVANILMESTKLNRKYEGSLASYSSQRLWGSLSFTAVKPVPFSSICCEELNAFSSNIMAAEKEEPRAYRRRQLLEMKKRFTVLGGLGLGQYLHRSREVPFSSTCCAALIAIRCNILAAEWAEPRT